MSEQQLRLHPVFPGHVVQLLQTLFHLVQVSRVPVQAMQISPQLSGRLADMYRRIFQ